MSENILSIFDRQLYPLSPLLRDELDLSPSASNAVATTIHQDVLRSRAAVALGLTRRSPIDVRHMLHASKQAIAFNWSFGGRFQEAGMAFAYTVAMNYMTFVFFRDTVFRCLTEEMDRETAAHKCARLLYCGKSIAAMRHAAAHGNWRFGNAGPRFFIEYWAKDPNDQGAYARHEMDQAELLYLYTLSRAVAYAALSAVCDEHDPDI